MLGELLTNWTIRLALACYVAWLAGWLTSTSPRWPIVARRIWTAGCLLFVAHVACAFHFYHHWSHASAWHKTAEETQRMLGVAFGDGILGSYLFLVAWVVDVLWLWTAGSPAVATASSATTVPPAGPIPQRTPGWRLAVHFFLLFIAFNGAIVFEAGPTRWFGIAACVSLALLAGRSAYNALAGGKRGLARPRYWEMSKNQRTEEPSQTVQ
jgi:hypothetical protein